jgi:hypothetical protein
MVTVGWDKLTRQMTELRSPEKREDLDEDFRANEKSKTIRSGRCPKESRVSTKISGPPVSARRVLHGNEVLTGFLLNETFVTLGSV